MVKPAGHQKDALDFFTIILLGSEKAFLFWNPYHQRSVDTDTRVRGHACPPLSADTDMDTDVKNFETADTDADTDIKNFETVDTDADTDIEIFQAADTDVDTDMIF